MWYDKKERKAVYSRVGQQIPMQPKLNTQTVSRLLISPQQITAQSLSMQYGISLSTQLHIRATVQTKVQIIPKHTMFPTASLFPQKIPSRRPATHLSVGQHQQMQPKLNMQQVQLLRISQKQTVQQLLSMQFGKRLFTQ